MRAVEELLVAAPSAVEKVLATDEALRRVDLQGREASRASRDEITRVVGTDAHQGVAAKIRAFTYADAGTLDRIDEGVVVVLDHIEDPQNVGAIARSAVVFGAKALVVAKDRAAGVSPGAMKASAGAVFRVPVVQVANIAETVRQLARCGFTVVGADANGGGPPGAIEWGRRTALVLGAERRGLRPVVREACTEVVRIPQADARIPLNVSAAAAVLLYLAVTPR